MARVVIRCQYTGHYVFTGIEMRPGMSVEGGRVYCPYCAAEHVWNCTEARLDPVRTAPNKPLVRQAS